MRSTCGPACANNNKNLTTRSGFAPVRKRSTRQSINICGMGSGTAGASPMTMWSSVLAKTPKGKFFSTHKAGPALWVEKNFPFGVFANTEDHIVIGDAPAVPLPIPQIFIDCLVDLLRTGAKPLRVVRFLLLFAHAGPQVERIGGGHRQPTRNAFAFIAHHVHGVAPVTLINEA